jgi:hypothetical protein
MWAVQNDFDRVAWTTGEQQAERYDLSKHVDAIEAWRMNDERKLYDINVRLKDGKIQSYNDIHQDKLADIIGKELAEKVVNSPDVGDKGARFEGLDLKVGGEGMKGFYDKILPAMVNKLVKKWGGKVSQTNISQAEPDDDKYQVVLPNGKVVHSTDNLKNAEAVAKSFPGGKVEEINFKEMVHSLDITPAMRDSIKQGLPLFQGNDTKRGSFNPSTSTITLLAKADLSTFLHESGHFFLETLNKIAQEPDAPTEIKQDMESILKWFGIEADGKPTGGTNDGELNQDIESDGYLPAARIEPPHEVVDRAKYQALLSRFEETGKFKGRPVLVWEDASGSLFALTGSHRLAAAREADIDVPVVYVDEDISNYEAEDGSTITDVIGTGDDRVADFLKQFGDERAARLMTLENEANNSDFALNQGGTNDGELAQGGIVTDTPEFKAWSGGHEVIKADAEHEFEADKGVVVEALHGTTGDFHTFDKERANPESDMGAGFYFTNNKEDVGENYAGEGPDLTQKIQLTAERIASETDREYDDPDVVAEARAKFVTHGGATLPVFVRFNKPFVLGGVKETTFTYEQHYDEETDEYGEEQGTLLDFIEALRDVSSEFHDGDVEGVIGALIEKATDYGEVSASDLVRILKETEEFLYFTDDNGNMASNEITRRALEQSGFDGVIDQTVNEKFGSERRVGKSMEGMDHNTVHFVAFEPTQIKSVFNKGTFDPNDPNILNQGGDEAKTTGSLPSGRTRLEVWNAMSLEEQREYHEKFARGFEAYLFEGRAPSLEMQGVFSRFRGWLLKVYQSIKALRVDINDDVRSVFDRMLASNEQIKEAEAARSFEPMFKTPEEAGMTPEQYKEYTEAGIQATLDAAHEFEKRSLRDMKWLSNAKGKALKKLQAQADEQRKAVKEEVTEEVQGEPIYRALRWLKRGEMTDADGNDIVAEGGA